MGCAPVEGQPASPPTSPGRLRARLRAAQAAARDVTSAAAESSARVGKRVHEDNETAESAPSTESSKRPATTSGDDD